MMSQRQKPLVLSVCVSACCTSHGFPPARERRERGRESRRKERNDGARFISLTAIPLRGPPRGRAIRRGGRSALPRLARNIAIQQSLSVSLQTDRREASANARHPVRAPSRRPAKRISRERYKPCSIVTLHPRSTVRPAALRLRSLISPLSQGACPRDGGGLRGALKDRDHFFRSDLPALRARRLLRNPPGVLHPCQT